MKNLLLILTLVLLGSCSSAVKEEVREDRMTVGHISQEQMIDKMREMINRIPGITKDQHDKLLNLHADVYADSQDISEKIKQNKVLLFKYLAEDKNKEINFVKKDLKKLYNRKLELMFQAFDKVKAILGKDAKKVMSDEEFRLYHGFSHERF
ncbi:hypothetical protein [Bacteriovorax sp. Seq25_V]|uniref:hypothetical protein n=1 Tax=Bacteriovorax sp. Seq25_V TaxID=1201288 RepID=UPI00038A292D|nr:hypothetical protein [Bacteriovorax sp. Seq25_V]EQC47262.1 hypothetical protein M900_0785 [Bacteriovorax sp. Seq25_V]